MPALGAPIILDATHGEGGGALLRTAVVMAALTQQPLRANGIRGNTKWPGLSSEDVAIIQALAYSSSAETTGAIVGSHDLSFLPTRRPRSLNGELEVPNIEGTGETVCALSVVNALAPLLARSGAFSSIEVRGETYGTGILTYDYFAHVTVEALKRLGLYVIPDQLEAGFGRGSQGKVRLEIEPSALHGIEWSNRGRMLSANAMVATNGLAASVADRAVSHLENLAQNAKIELTIDRYEPVGSTNGAHVTVWAEFERGIGGANAMGQKGVRIESVAQNAFDSFFNWLRSDATIDSYLADQIILVAAMAEGDSVFSVPKLTPRLLTTIWVIKQFVPIRVTVKGREDEPGVIAIRK